MGSVKGWKIEGNCKTEIRPNELSDVNNNVVPLPPKKYNSPWRFSEKPTWVGELYKNHPFKTMVFEITYDGITFTNIGQNLRKDILIIV